ncbi:MAG: hypothetical protein GY810_17390 [Aureispira sp.]|nr:hypothetical protein [Aureispira sp.]
MKALQNIFSMIVLVAFLGCLVNIFGALGQGEDVETMQDVEPVVVQEILAYNITMS